MFGSNPFGQSTSSPFGSQPAFGQTSNASSSPFAPKPFGSPSPFGSQTGSSIFGGMSSSALGSSPGFGNPAPTFGAQSGSAFGNASTASSGSSIFGQKPAFGGFGSSTAQPTPFGGSFQQSQPAFGNSLFGSSSSFGAPSQPSFGSTSTPAFGASSTPAFGSTTNSVFGGSATTGGFGLSTPFGSSSSAFGSTSTPAFGATSAPSFGSSPTFGSGSSPLFGSSSISSFGTTGAGFGTPTVSAFNVGSSPAFGQSVSAFGGSPFGAASGFGTQTTSFGVQTTSPNFGNAGFSQSSFGVQRGGSRVTTYSAVPETDGASGTQPGGKLLSISAMPVYKEKSHEELRWEDYQSGDKGGPASASQNVTSLGFSSPSFISSASTAFPQSSVNPFSSSTSSNIFGPKTPTFNTSNFASSAVAPFSSSPFTTSASNVFSSTVSQAPSLFSTATQPFGPTTTSSIFNSSSTSAPGQTSIFGPTSGPSPTSAFGTALNFAVTQSSPLFPSSVPQTPLQPSPIFTQTATTPQSNVFSAPSSGFSLFNSTSPLTGNSLGFSQPMALSSNPFQSAQPAQNSGGFNFSNFTQPQAGNFSGTGTFSNTTGAISINTQGPAVAQATSVMNPFGTLPAMPQMSVGRPGVSPSIQYGISNLPVVDKPAPVRISSLVTSRHLSQRRFRLPVRKYHPKTDGPKVPFFADDEEMPSTPKADAFFVPRENPRALVISPIDSWPPRSSAEKIKEVTPRNFDNGNSLPHDHRTNGKADILQENEDNGHVKEHFTSVNGKHKTNGANDGPIGERDSSATRISQQSGEAEKAHELRTDIKSLLPQLRHSEYYTVPGIQELAAKERAEPGFCSHVKNFVVGRKGCGSIMFFGETDVRGLNLDDIVTFNDREVLVYMDDSKKPPVGQGLNKPAEITLLNIKCTDKKTGKIYTEGPNIEKYRALLRRKAEAQGAEFASYDPVNGEWKFRVDHFSVYRFEDNEEDDPAQA